MFSSRLAPSQSRGYVENMGAAASCQAAIAKDYEKLLLAGLGTFVRCKKTGLGSGDIMSQTDLTGCVDEVLEDPKGKLSRARSKIISRMTRKCGPYVALAFPAKCSAYSSAAGFADCIGRIAACRSCQMLNAADDLDRNCDLFDDAEPNDSCSDATQPQ